MVLNRIKFTMESDRHRPNHLAHRHLNHAHFGAYLIVVSSLYQHQRPHQQTIRLQIDQLVPL